MQAGSSGRYMSLPSDADSIFPPPACAIGLMSKVPLLTFCSAGTTVADRFAKNVELSLNAVLMDWCFAA